MTLNGKRPEKAKGGMLNAECQHREASAAWRSALLVPRFTLRLSCLTLPALLLLSAAPGSSIAASTPYQPIVERNVFGLKPPPPPPDPESLKPPPPKLTLTGIMTIFGKKQALLKAPASPAPPPKPGQPPEQPKEHSYILAEGQREDGITILQIDDKSKSVKLDAEGTIFTLTFPTNEVHTASSPHPGGLPSPTGFGGATPNLMPPRVIPGRPLRIPSMGSSSATSVGAGSSGVAESGALGSSGVAGAPGGVNVNGNSLNFGGTLQPQFQDASTFHDPALANLNPEATAALIEAQRQATASEVQAGKVAAPPITPYTPPGSLGAPAEDQAPAPTGGRGPSRLSRLLNRPGMPQMPQ